MRLVTSSVLCCREWQHTKLRKRTALEEDDDYEVSTRSFDTTASPAACLLLLALPFSRLISCVKGG